MTYTKQTWVDGSGGGTKINATRLTHMEDGIGGVDTIVSGANTTSATAEATTTTAASKTTTANTNSASATSTAASKVQKSTMTVKGDLFVATGSGAVSRLPAVTTQKIIIPAYFYPALGFGIAYWNALIAVGAPGIYGVIANPASGPGGSADSNYVSIISQCQAAGIRVFGYVNTQYGTIAAATVDADVNAWSTLYGITDIFFDLVATGPSDLAYFTARSSHVYSNDSSAQLIFNPGTDIHEGYLSLCDIVCNFEGTKTDYDSFTWALYGATYTQDWPASKFWHLVYDVSTSALMQDVIHKSKNVPMGNNKAQGAKWVYVTDDTAAVTPWDTTATYLQTEAEVALAGFDGRILTSDPTEAHKMKWGISIDVGTALPSTGRLGDLFFTRDVTAVALTGAAETDAAGIVAVTT